LGLIAGWQVIGTAPVAITGMEAMMATKIAVTLEDDLDGGPADETVRFAIDGTGYEIDLSTNVAAFRWRLTPPHRTRRMSRPS
jgi:hypothetical protein